MTNKRDVIGDILDGNGSWVQNILAGLIVLGLLIGGIFFVAYMGGTDVIS